MKSYYEQLGERLAAMTEEDRELFAVNILAGRSPLYPRIDAVPSPVPRITSGTVVWMGTALVSAAIYHEGDLIGYSSFGISTDGVWVPKSRGPVAKWLDKAAKWTPEKDLRDAVSDAITAAIQSGRTLDALPDDRIF